MPKPWLIFSIMLKPACCCLIGNVRRWPSRTGSNAKGSSLIVIDLGGPGEALAAAFQPC